MDLHVRRNGLAVLACLTIAAFLHLPCKSGSEDATAEQIPHIGNRADLLRAARNWAYQIQNLDQPGAVDKLAASPYDVLVIEPTRTDRNTPGFPTRDVVARLKSSPGATPGRKKIVLAYIDVGQAEDWRYYWEPHWVAPTTTTAGIPDFMITVDPDGWSGNYPVAFWDTRWQAIIATSPTGQLQYVLDDGFDGIYMDWIEAYTDDFVTSAADGVGVDPQQAMLDFVALIRSTARAQDPDFLIVPQNAPELGFDRPDDYFPIIDAIALEDIHFSGDGDAPWGSAGAGDTRTPDSGMPDYTRQWFYMVLAEYQKAGIPVFNCDYCVDPANIEEAYRLSLAQGYIVFVSQTPLDRLPPYRAIFTDARPSWRFY